MSKKFPPIEFDYPTIEKLFLEKESANPAFDAAVKTDALRWLADETRARAEIYNFRKGSDVPGGFTAKSVQAEEAFKEIHPNLVADAREAIEEAIDTYEHGRVDLKRVQSTRKQTYVHQK